jgi:hypothetical protein
MLKREQNKEKKQRKEDRAKQKQEAQEWKESFNQNIPTLKDTGKRVHITNKKTKKESPITKK